MNKKVSLLIALVMSVGISTSTFAASPNTVQAQNTSITTEASGIVSNNGVINLTLEDALNNLEKNNTTIKLLDEKVKLYNRQYDSAHMKAIQIDSEGKSEVNYSGSGYVSVKLAETVAPLQASQQIDYAKHDRETKLKDLKINLQKYYMDALSRQDEITNINSTIENLDKQIEQTKAKINQGTLTSDSLDSLNVQKSQQIASLNTPQSQMQQDILNIKQLLNLDLNSDLQLATTKKDFVKYDDSSIEQIIDAAAEKNYSILKINNSINILKMQADIYEKYSRNDTSSEINAKLSLQDTQNTLEDTKLQMKIAMWQAYYGAKNYEDNIETEKVNLENAQSSYDKSVIKFNTGQVDQLQVDSAKLALDKQKIALQKAVNDYMVTVEAFINLLTQ